jgi:hypothetical protein
MVVIDWRDEQVLGGKCETFFPCVRTHGSCLNTAASRWAFFNTEFAVDHYEFSQDQFPILHTAVVEIVLEQDLISENTTTREEQKQSCR